MWRTASTDFPRVETQVLALFCRHLPSAAGQKRNKHKDFLQIKKVRPAWGKAGRARTRSGDGEGGDVTEYA
jgi:hypothetical protein